MAVKPFASTGKAGRIGDVHIDIITDIRAPRTYDRTTVALESGAPVTSHRQRGPYKITVSVVVSDTEPIAGASLIGLWETDHARKTRDRLRDRQASGTEVAFFDGVDIWRTPSGSRTWVIDEIDEGKSPGKEGIWEATIILGELTRFRTQFTDALPDVDDDMADTLDGVIDKGPQSTETVPSGSGISV